VVLVGLLAVGAVGCRDEASASSRSLDDPWLPGNGEFDESCENCEDFVEIDDPHAGDLVIKVVDGLDDPLAQWGECISSFFACWEEEKPVPDCVAHSQCPEPCKAEFRREVSGAEDEEQEIYAFNRVFVDDEAPCRAPEVHNGDDEVAP